MTFQGAAGRQGRQFAQQCDDALKDLGFELHGRRIFAEVGVEVDQMATAPSGNAVWFEYKGSVRGKIPGLRRTDTLKKAICNGALLRAVADSKPYVVLTSHLPDSGSGLAMMGTALKLGLVDEFVCIYQPGWEGPLLSL